MKKNGEKHFIDIYFHSIFLRLFLNVIFLWNIIFQIPGQIVTRFGENYKTGR